MESFRIGGVSGGNVLEFFGRSPEDADFPMDRYCVRLSGPNLFAALAILTGYTPWNPVPIFADMAERWRGWPGQLAWDSLYGEIILRCRQVRCGHVAIAVEMRSGWADTDWSLRATVETEAGQLDRIARHAANFFGA